jgi:hypothetical protein
MLDLLKYWNRLGKGPEGCRRRLTHLSQPPSTACPSAPAYSTGSILETYQDQAPNDHVLLAFSHPCLRFARSAFLPPFVVQSAYTHLPCVCARRPRLPNGRAPRLYPLSHARALHLLLGLFQPRAPATRPRCVGTCVSSAPALFGMTAPVFPGAGPMHAAGLLDPAPPPTPICSCPVKLFACQNAGRRILRPRRPPAPLFADASASRPCTILVHGVPPRSIQSPFSPPLPPRTYICHTTRPSRTERAGAVFAASLAPPHPCPVCSRRLSAFPGQPGGQSRRLPSYVGGVLRRPLYMLCVPRASCV